MSREEPEELTEADQLTAGFSAEHVITADVSATVIRSSRSVGDQTWSVEFGQWQLDYEAASHRMEQEGERQRSEAVMLQSHSRPSGCHLLCYSVPRILSQRSERPAGSAERLHYPTWWVRRRSGRLFLSKGRSLAARNPALGMAASLVGWKGLAPCVQVDREKTMDDTLLNELGTAGWELVAIVPIIGAPQYPNRAITMYSRYVFK